MRHLRAVVTFALTIGAVAGCGFNPPPTVTPANETVQSVRIRLLPDVLDANGKKLDATESQALRGAIANSLRRAGFELATESSGGDELVGQIEATYANLGLIVKSSLTLRDARRIVDRVEWESGHGVCGTDRVACPADWHAASLANALAVSPGIMRYARAHHPQTNQAVAGTTTPQPTASPQAASPPASPSAPAPVRSPSVSTPAKVVSASPQPAAYALVIGIENYRDVPPPTGARGDAERFATMLRSTFGIPEAHMVVALDNRAARTDIEKHLDWLKANVEAGSRIYFYFSGHGAPDATGGSSYLLPYDGDAKYLERTALPLSSVLNALRQTKARETLAIVDSCFSGAGGRSVLPPGARPLVRVVETKPTGSVALFSASQAAEISGPSPKGGGLFTEHVLAALGEGGADANGDGQISLAELSEYVTPRVQRDAKRENRNQTPQLQAGVELADTKKFIVGWGYATR